MTYNQPRSGEPVEQIPGQMDIDECIELAKGDVAQGSERPVVSREDAGSIPAAAAKRPKTVAEVVAIQLRRNRGDTD